MDNVNIISPVLEKKMDYRFDEKNFEAPSEIMVTITLGEYRELVAFKASGDVKISQAENDKYERNRENDSLKAENSALKAELYELRKRLDISEVSDESVDS